MTRKIIFSLISLSLSFVFFTQPVFTTIQAATTPVTSPIATTGPNELIDLDIQTQAQSTAEATLAAILFYPFDKKTIQ